MWALDRRDFLKFSAKLAAAAYILPERALERIVNAEYPAEKNSFLGLNITHPVNYKHGQSVDDHFAILDMLNPGTVRLEARSEDNQGMDFDRTKTMLMRAKENGSRTILLVNNAIIPKSPFVYVNDGNAYADAFCEKIEYLANQVGEFVDAWQVMNEPNDNYWLYKDSGTRMFRINPDQFAKLVSTSSKKIKTSFPNAIIIPGGLLPPMHKTDYDSAKINDEIVRDPLVYLHSFLTGLGSNAIDGIAAHFYLPLGKFESHAKLYANAMKGTGLKLWVTEFGCDSLKSQVEQAQKLFLSYEQINKINKSMDGFIECACWYNDHDWESEKPWEGAMGVYRYDEASGNFKFKNSFFAYLKVQEEL